MPRPTHPVTPGSGRKPPLPPALERKLQQRGQTRGQALPQAAQQPPRGGRARRAVRHQGR